MRLVLKSDKFLKTSFYSSSLSHYIWWLCDIVKSFSNFNSNFSLRAITEHTKAGFIHAYNDGWEWYILHTNDCHCEKFKHWSWLSVLHSRRTSAATRAIVKRVEVEACTWRLRMIYIKSTSLLKIPLQAKYAYSFSHSNLSYK